jgi:hypothetical protein
MKTVLTFLLLALVALAGDQLPDGDHGDLYHPNGSPSGGEWNSMGPLLTLDPDGFGEGEGSENFWWDPVLEAYTTDEVRVFVDCVGQTPDGGCNCWSYEIWIKSISPPITWTKIEEGLLY